MWSPFLKRRGTSSSSPKDTSDAALPLEQRIVRVTKEDLRCVTADDIKRVRESLTDEQLTSAVGVVLEANRFVDAVSGVSSSTWAEAATGVTEVQMGLTGRIMRERLVLLYNVLPYVSTDFLTIMSRSHAELPPPVRGAPLPSSEQAERW